ncbi:MAG: hypothetical protein LBF22_13670 [Deltaproteobacteria bacterium]|nr:hypothetical protein [Deltaproteobacteria bacterium]
MSSQLRYPRDDLAMRFGGSDFVSCCTLSDPEGQKTKISITLTTSDIRERVRKKKMGNHLSGSGGQTFRVMPVG